MAGQDEACCVILYYTPGVQLEWVTSWGLKRKFYTRLFSQFMSDCCKYLPS